MNDLFDLSGDVFHEVESLADRMRRQAPKFAMTNASFTAVCGTPSISVHSQDDEASPHETIMFNILVTLIDVPDRDYSRNNSASAAAQATNNLFLSMTTNPSEQRSYAALCTVWSELFNFIKQIPAEHPATQRLVDWIIELRKLEVQTLHIWNRDIELWKDLPLLGPEWLEWVEEYYVHPEDGKGSRFKAFRDLFEEESGYALWNFWK